MFQNATFTIQVIEKLPVGGYKNGIIDNAMVEYQLQGEDYCLPFWLKWEKQIYK